MIARNALVTGLALTTLLAGASCSSGGGGATAGTTTFQVDNISVQDGAVWQINREIVISFSEPVDFTTVSSNTINLRSLADVPAIGVFKLRDAQTVVFQPNCPTLEDFSDAGLQPDDTYVLRIRGENTSENTVQSLTGVPLGLQQTRKFSTPASTQPSIVFQDLGDNPPAPVLRPKGSALENATYLELGGNPNERVYFELEANQEVVLSDPGFLARLNLYSELGSRIAILIAFNQPVNPSDDNISDDRLQLEFREPSGTWIPIDTRVTLVANCTETGAVVRLEPIGVLPQSSEVRAVILPGFQDLVGDAVRQGRSNFGVVPTRTTAFTSLTPSDALSDELNETFIFGGDSPNSFEDTGALFDSPVAEWGGGKLSAAFSFEGTGGPGGTFDWVVHEGEIFFFDTNSTPINGGPDGIPTTTQIAADGFVDVRNLTIERGGEIRVQGPNPMRINATGEVRIEGRLDLGGFTAKDVATLNTGNQVEVGGAGVAGGGKGGNANDNISGPTPRGGRGEAPFRQGSLGGQGGEMGVSANNNKNARRPGGGGGGRFTKGSPSYSPDWMGAVTFVELSLAARAGSNGNPMSRGAESQISPSAGGQPGQGPFIDQRNDNDFFGVRPIVESGELIGLVRGELPSLWAGYGGGGGGNAGKTFPNPNWNPNSDEKGGGGGGGAGSLHIKALGRIVFGRGGIIFANGGRGGTGENTNFLDHIGGTGGGGSGGHVVLESAAVVDFTAALGTTGRDVILAAGPPLKTGSLEYVDSCQDAAAFCCLMNTPPSPGGCRGQSNGGAGGAGLIQIHVPDPTLPPDTMAPADILVPDIIIGAADVIDQLTSPPAYVMIPTFGKRSQARSRWISIGGADRKPDGTEGLVRFLFDGIDPDTGRILTTGSTVTPREPLVEDGDILASSTAQISPDGLTLELRGAALDAIRAGTTPPAPAPSGVSNDVYLRTPALLQDCVVRMLITDTPLNFEDFSIARAVYEEGAASPGDEVLRLRVSGTRPLTAFNTGDLEGAGFQLLPRFFFVVTNGIPDSLPSTAFVQLRFQAARDNGFGEPDETDLLEDWTSDITKFNNKPPGELQFFRYEVEFDLDKDNSGISADTEPVTLDFLKIPFVF